jgi:hypothetical protein
MSNMEQQYDLIADIKALLTSNGSGSAAIIATVAARLLSAGSVAAADLLASILARLPAQGSALAAASIPVTLATDGALLSVAGVTSGAAVITDAAGTLQQYLRGLVKLVAGLIGPQSAANSMSLTQLDSRTAVVVSGGSSVTDVTTAAGAAAGSDHWVIAANKEYILRVDPNWSDVSAPGDSDFVRGVYKLGAACADTQRGAGSLAADDGDYIRPGEKIRICSPTATTLYVLSHANSVAARWKLFLRDQAPDGI